MIKKLEFHQICDNCVFPPDIGEVVAKINEIVEWINNKENKL